MGILKKALAVGGIAATIASSGQGKPSSASAQAQAAERVRIQQMRDKATRETTKRRGQTIGSR